MKKLPLFVLVSIFLAACTAAPTPSGPQTLTVMVHDSFAVSEEVITAFESANQVTVQFIASGDTGSALNKAILSKNNPLADVFYGVDNTFLSRALDEDIFEPYNAPLLSTIPDQFKLDPQNGALPVDYSDVCLNYDIAYFEDKAIPPPQSLEDLLKAAELKAAEHHDAWLRAKAEGKIAGIAGLEGAEALDASIGVRVNDTNKLTSTATAEVMPN